MESTLNQILGPAIGAFLGVVAGIVVMIVSSRIQARAARKQQVRNLCFELRLNIKKIDGWLTEVSRYRNAVNGDSLHRWFGYFDLSKTVSTTAMAMLNSGVLYDTLSYEDIASLQEVYGELSPAGENYLNGRLESMRNKFQQLADAKALPVWLASVKPEAVRIADFWEYKLSNHRDALTRIAATLGDPKGSGEDK